MVVIGTIMSDVEKKEEVPPKPVAVVRETGGRLVWLLLTWV